MNENLPRHAQSTRKRHPIERADAIGILSIAIGVLGIMISVLFGMGIIGPSAGQPVAPGPVVVCYAVHAPAYCPAAPSP